MDRISESSAVRYARKGIRRRQGAAAMINIFTFNGKFPDLLPHCGDQTVRNRKKQSITLADQIFQFLQRIRSGKVCRCSCRIVVGIKKA